MEQAIPLYVKSPSKSDGTAGRDRIGFGLSVLMLCLLPIERFVLPFRLTVADFALVLLTAYGLWKAWHTHQQLCFPLLLPMWLILISSPVATLAGSAHLNSVMAIVQEIYLFAWFIVLTNLLRAFPFSDLDRLMKIWSAISCVEAVTILLGMFRIGPSFFYTPPYESPDSFTGVVRGIGTYANSNAAGTYLFISIFVLLATSWPVWLRFTLGMWLLVGTIGTGSLGSLFSTLGSLAVLGVVIAITEDPHPTTLRGGIVGVGAGVVAAALFALSLWPSSLPGVGLHKGGRLLELTFGRLPRALAGRLVLLNKGWSVYTLHPWGTGPNSSALYAASLHNDYVAFLFERGPLGGIGWLWMVGSTLFAPLQAARQAIDSSQRWRVLVLGAGFLACAVNALSHEISHFRQVWVLMAFLFALSYALSPPAGNKIPTERIGIR